LKKNRFHKTVRFKFILRYLTLSTLSMGILFFAIHNRSKVYFEKKTNQHIVETLNGLDWLDTIRSFDNLDKIEDEFNYRAIPEGIENVFYILYNSNGKAIASSELSEWEASNQLTSLEIWDTISFPDNHEKIYLNRSWNHAHLKKITLKSSPEIVQIGATYLQNNHVVVYGKSLNDDMLIHKQLMRTIGFTFLLINLMSFIALYNLIHRVLLDISEISQTADRIKKGNQNREVSILNSGLEVENLARSFNKMIEKINMFMHEMEGISNDITHDLRSPVTSIRSISETSLTADLSEHEYNQAFERIIDKSDHLISMINTLLEIAEIESKKQDSLFEEVDIGEILENAYEFFLNVAEEKRINLELILKEDELKVSGIRAHLQRAVSNIIDNALKFTPADGRVSISAYKENKKIIAEVNDNGVGIEPKHQQRIFNKFFQVDSSRTIAGNGLGLSFLLAVISNHNGKILLNSKIDEGTTIKIILEAL
jgi:signal transduction histidine kinase